MGVWLVTGATAGFGAAIARRAVRDGHRVVATGRRVARLEALRDELGADKCHIVDLDVRDRAATEALLKDLPAAWAEVDVLVRCVLACAVTRLLCGTSLASKSSPPIYPLPRVSPYPSPPPFFLPAWRSGKQCGPCAGPRGSACRKPGRLGDDD